MSASFPPHALGMTDTNISPVARVVVGVDGSDSSLEALRYAERIAPLFDAAIEAVTAWEFPNLYYPIDGWSPEADAEKILTTSIRQAFTDSPPAGLITTIVPGSAAHALIERSKGADMLVLGSRGHGGFVGLLLGSVSTACAQHAHCPVLIVHPAEGPPETAPRQAITREEDARGVSRTPRVSTSRAGRPGRDAAR